MVFYHFWFSILLLRTFRFSVKSKPIVEKKKPNCIEWNFFSRCTEATLISYCGNSAIRFQMGLDGKKICQYESFNSNRNYFPLSLLATKMLNQSCCHRLCHMTWFFIQSSIQLTFIFIFSKLNVTLTLIKLCWRLKLPQMFNFSSW